MTDGIPRALSKSLLPKVIHACGEKASKGNIGNAGRCSVPIYHGWVAKLVSKCSGASGLLLAIDGEGGK